MACSGRKSEYKIGKTYINGDETKISRHAPRGALLKCTGFSPCPHKLLSMGKCKGSVLWEGINKPSCATWNGNILALKKEQHKEIKRESIEDRVKRITQQIKRR